MTTKRILFAAGSVLIALILALVALLWPSGPRTRSASSVECGGGAVVHAGSVLADANQDSGSATRRTGVAGTTAVAARRLPPFVESTGVRLVVLTSDEGVRAPGAEVRVFERPADTLAILRTGDDWVGPDFEAFMRANGRAFVADDMGEVDVPRPRTSAFVCARLGDRFGWGGLDPEEGGMAEIRMIRPHTITARVRDARGLPRANVRVAFGRIGDRQSYWEAPTNALGEVRVPAIEVLVRELGLEEREPFVLRLSIPSANPVEQWFRADDLPTAPVEFTLPATGSVRVTVVDDARRVVPVSGTLTLTSISTQYIGRPSLDIESSSCTASLVDGVALVTRVGLGLHFEAEMDMPGTGDNSVQLEGPIADGEEIAVEMPLATDHTLLLGRLLDEGRRPLSNSTFDWRRVLDDGHSIQASGRDRLVTDGEGRFIWTLRRSAQATGKSTHRTGYLCELGDAPTRRQATIHFPLEITAAMTDLGDIVMSPAGPLVSGRVVNERDEPVVNAGVLPFVKAGDDYESAETFDPAFTAADGGFAIFGPCLTLQFALEVAGPTVQGQRFTNFVCLGSRTDLLIRIDAAGELEGTALVDHDASLDDVVVSFTSLVGGERNVAVAETRRVADRLYFRFLGETPREGAVEFHAHGPDDAPVLVVPGVAMGAGRVSRPPELVDVDLKGLLSRVSATSPVTDKIEFAIVDSRGRAMPRGLLVGFDSDGDGGGEWPFGNGKARIDKASCALCESIEIWAPGCRVVRLEPPYASRRVALAPELEVEFTLVLPDRWRTERLEYRGSVNVFETDPPQYVPLAFSRMQPFLLDSRGRGSVGLPMAGRFNVYLSIRRPERDGREEIGFDFTPLNSVFVARETDGLQPVELVLDPDAIAQFNVALGFE